jgi:hypothetical protein
MVFSNIVFSNIPNPCSFRVRDPYGLRPSLGWTNELHFVNEHEPAFILVNLSFVCCYRDPSPAQPPRHAQKARAQGTPVSQVRDYRNYRNNTVTISPVSSLSLSGGTTR